MPKLNTLDALSFIARHGAAIASAIALEAALKAKPRKPADVRKAGLALIAAEAPNVNTTNPRVRAAIDELVSALSEE